MAAGEDQARALNLVDNLSGQRPVRHFLLPRSARFHSQWHFRRIIRSIMLRFEGIFCLSYTDWCSVRSFCWIQRTGQVYRRSILMWACYPSHRAQDPNVNIAPAKLESCCVWVHMAVWEGLRGWMLSIHLLTPDTVWNTHTKVKNRAFPAGKSHRKESSPHS